MRRVVTSTLRSAEGRLREIHPEFADTEFNWRTEIMERRWSTVHRLTDQGTGQTLYYKVFKPRKEHGDSPRDTTEARLARSAALTDQLIGSLASTPISAAPVLAVSPQEPAVITLGVPGRELKPSAFAGWPLGRKNRYDIARLTGLACAHIEDVGSVDNAEVSVDDTMAVVDHRADQSDAEALPSLKEAMKDIEARARERVEAGDSVYGHGDMSPTNLLIHDGGLNLIDFTWRSRLRGYDAGVFSFRLFASTAVSQRAMRRIDDALLDGYVTAAGAAYSNQAMGVVELLLLARGLANKSSRVRTRSLAALELALESGARRWSGENRPSAWIWSTVS